MPALPGQPGWRRRAPSRWCLHARDTGRACGGSRLLPLTHPRPSGLACRRHTMRGGGQPPLRGSGLGEPRLQRAPQPIHAARVAHRPQPPVPHHKRVGGGSHPSPQALLADWRIAIPRHALHPTDTAAIPITHKVTEHWPAHTRTAQYPSPMSRIPYRRFPVRRISQASFAVNVLSRIFANEHTAMARSH
jgi:hypothetical protein